MQNLAKFTHFEKFIFIQQVLKQNMWSIGATICIFNKKVQKMSFKNSFIWKSTKGLKRVHNPFIKESRWLISTYLHPMDHPKSSKKRRNWLSFYGLHFCYCFLQWIFHLLIFKGCLLYLTRRWPPWLKVQIIFEISNKFSFSILIANKLVARGVICKLHFTDFSSSFATIFIPMIRKCNLYFKIFWCGKQLAKCKL